jgi:hypothetical protein
MERIAVTRNAWKRITKNKWTIFSLVLLALVFSGALYYYRTPRSGSQEKVVETSRIGTGNIILSAAGLGTLIPNKEVSFGFKTSGQGQNRSASQIATAQAARQARGGNRMPAQLTNAVIEFLKKKAGS